MLRRRVLVLVCQCLHIVFRLSSPVSSLDKPNCFHTSGLKVAGASAASPTLSLCSLSTRSVRHFVPFSTVQACGVQRMMGSHGLMVTEVPTFLHSALLHLKIKMAWKADCLNRQMSTTLRHLHHCDTAKLLIL